MNTIAHNTEKFDWQGMEAAAVAQLVAAVHRVRAEYPDEHIYGAMFHEFHGDGSTILWPNLTVGTEEALAQVLAKHRAEFGNDEIYEGGLEHETRWSGPDLATAPDERGVRSVSPSEVEDVWAERCEVVASASGGSAAWQKVYDRFLRVFPSAVKKARVQLLHEGVVGQDFIAIANDEDGVLIDLCLTKEELSRHFPYLDKVAQERERLAALPLAEQIAEVTPQAVRKIGDKSFKTGLLVEYDALVRELGEAAVPALLDVVTGRAYGEAFKAIMLLAEINHATPEVIATLEQTMTDPEAGASGWAAAALARLGRMDLIVRHAAQLPVGVAASGLAGPYTSFRDRGKHHPLDYAPLEAALRACPELTDAVAEQLRPGRGFCKIDAGEVGSARAGLASPWPFIREHARLVLEEWEER